MKQQLAEIAYYEARVTRKTAAIGKAKSNTSKAYLQLGIDHSNEMINRIKSGMVKG